MKWLRRLPYIAIGTLNLVLGLVMIVDVVLELRSRWRPTYYLPPSSPEPEPAKDSLPA